MPADLRAECVAALTRVGLGEHAEAIAALGAPAVSIHTTRVDEAAIPLGASRIGGSPDLPADVPWPEWQGKPLSFLAQFDLRHVALFAPAGALPDAGFLSFFCDAELDGPWDDPAYAGGGRVMWHPARTPLVRRSAPSMDVEVFPACEVSMSSVLTAPEPDVVVGALDIRSAKAEYALYEALDALETGPRHHLLGHSYPIQNIPAVECVYAIGGLYGSGKWDSARAEQLRPTAAEWKLLFQLDSDDEAGMMWGDVGMLYFLVRESDLRDWRFDRGRMVFQCS